MPATGSKGSSAEAEWARSIAPRRSASGEVALKVIAPELAEDHRFRERFLRESRVAASLDHPHVVPIFNAGEDDGALFLAMRYVEGTDLGKLLAAEGALELAVRWRCSSRLRGARRGTRAGLVHRDVKPSNILVSVAGERSTATSPTSG